MLISLCSGADGLEPGTTKALDAVCCSVCARSSTDRASDYGSEGWGFESLRARKCSSRSDAIYKPKGRSLLRLGTGLLSHPCHTRRSNVPIVSLAAARSAAGARYADRLTAIE
jgi:hypothetical protein